MLYGIKQKPACLLQQQLSGTLHDMIECASHLGKDIDVWY
jgi:hypothetical protein